MSLGTRWEPATQRRVFIYDGLGCSYEDAAHETAAGGSVHISRMCNASVANTLKHIAKVCVRHSDAIKDPRYVHNQMAHVRAAIEDTTVCEVYVVGHSYGGFVAARICEGLDTHDGAAKIRLFTFGSIYMVRPLTTIAIITQFMNINDVALRCNGAQVPSKGTRWNTPYRLWDKEYSDEYHRHDNDFVMKVMGRYQYLCTTRDWWHDRAQHILWMRSRHGAHDRTPWQRVNPLNKLEWDVHSDYPSLNKLVDAFHEGGTVTVRHF